jgi:hypothetical protein
MLRFQDHLVDPGYLWPIRAKIGEGLREKYDLMETVPQSLLALLRQLETGADVRNTTSARLYAEVDECLAAMARAAGKKLGDP